MATKKRASNGAGESPANGLRAFLRERLGGSAPRLTLGQVAAKLPPLLEPTAREAALAALDDVESWTSVNVVDAFCSVPMSEADVARVRAFCESQDAVFPSPHLPPLEDGNEFDEAVGGICPALPDRNALQHDGVPASHEERVGASPTRVLAFEDKGRDEALRAAFERDAQQLADAYRGLQQATGTGTSRPFVHELAAARTLEDRRRIVALHNEAFATAAVVFEAVRNPTVEKEEAQVQKLRALRADITAFALRLPSPSQYENFFVAEVRPRFNDIFDFQRMCEHCGRVFARDVDDGRSMRATFCSRACTQASNRKPESERASPLDKWVANHKAQCMRSEKKRRCTARGLCADARRYVESRGASRALHDAMDREDARRSVDTDGGALRELDLLAAAGWHLEK